MAALTNYAKPKVLDKLLRDTGSFPTAWWYGLFTTAQDEDESGTECADVNYVRRSITFGAAVVGSIANNTTIIFPPMAAEQIIVAVGIFDDETAGHCWLFQNLATGVTIPVAAEPRVISGGQIVTGV